MLSGRSPKEGSAGSPVNSAYESHILLVAKGISSSLLVRGQNELAGEAKTGFR